MFYFYSSQNIIVGEKNHISLQWSQAPNIRLRQNENYGSIILQFTLSNMHGTPDNYILIVLEGHIENYLTT